MQAGRHEVFDVVIFIISLRFEFAGFAVGFLPRSSKYYMKSGRSSGRGIIKYISRQLLVWVWMGFI
jgi:hypothetical protein